MGFIKELFNNKIEEDNDFNFYENALLMAKKALDELE